MRVTLIGAGGMLATALSQRFAAETLTELSERDCDITKSEAVERVILATNPEVILNAAAFTNVDRCETEEALATAVNGDAVGTLAAVAKKISAVLVHLSTDYVFDGCNPSGYVEGDTPNPINAYGRSKALGERLLAGSGAKYYLVRTSWLYGQNGKNFVDTILQLGKEKPTLEVVNDQQGSPTYTVDLADALHSLLEHRAPHGVYHRTNAGSITWYDFARTIFQLAGSKVIVKPVTSDRFPRPARRPAVSVLQTTKLPPLRPWTEALKDYLANRQRR